MPVDWEEFEAVETPTKTVDWSEFEEATDPPDNARGFGDLKVAEREQDKGIRRDALLEEKKRADFNSAFDADNLRAIEAVETGVKAFSQPWKGAIHGTRQMVGLEDPNDPRPIVPPLPRTNPELIRGMAPHLIPQGAAEVASGAQQAAAGLGDFMLDPDYIALGGVGAVPKAIQGAAGAVFTADMASHLKEQSGRLVESIKEGSPTDITREYLNTLLTGLGTVAPVAHSVLPKSAETVARKATEKELAQVDAKIKPKTPGEMSVEDFYEKNPEKRPSTEKLPGEIEISDFEVEAPLKSEAVPKIDEKIEETKTEEIPAGDDLGASREANIATTVSEIPTVREPEIVGMGGAVPGEFAPPKEFKTSNKNEVVDRERVELGLEPAMQPLRHTFQEAWDEAMVRMDENPRYQDDLIADLKENPRGLKDDIENAVVLHRRADLKNEQAKIAREMTQAFEDGRLEEAKDAQVRFDRITEEIQAVSDITKTSGSINARTLNARKMMADQDFTLSAMIMEKRAAKGGKPLTTQETVEIQKIADEYKTKVEAAEKSLAEKDQRIADLEAQKAFERIKSETKPSNYVIQIAEKIVSALDKRASAARERLKAKFARTSTGVDPTIILDLAEIGASHIGHFGLDFVKWSAKMTEEFGENVKPYLEEAFKVSQKIIDDQATKFGGKKRSKEVTETIKKTDPKNRVEGAKERIAKGEKIDLGMLAHQLAKDFVKQGIKTRDALIDVLHPALQQIDPKITRRQTMDALSGYGDFKKLSKEEVDVQLRDLKGQLQQVAKLEDMQAGKAPEKTGVERRTPSDEERRLIKQVEEAKRKGGYKVTDPATQLKSALDAVKTRLRNAITDLETQIESRTKIVKKKTDLKYDAEANALKAKRDELQKEFDDIFGKRELTDEQRTRMAIKAVERTIAEYEKKLSTGDISPLKKPSTTKVTPELERARSRRDALKEQLQELRDIANPKKTPEERALQSFKTRTANKIADLEERLVKGDFSKKKPVEYTKDKEAVDLQYEVEKVKRKWNEALFKDKLKNRTPSQRAADTVKEALLFQKAWKTAFDLSAIFRQGGFVALGNPIRALKIMPDMFRSMKSEKEQFRIEEEIRNRPNAPLYKEAGLFLSGHADTLTKMEEAYLGRWAEKVPFVNHSARAYTTFLNRLRADSFDALAASLSKDGKPTKAEVKAIANFVNVATGRGSVGPTSNMGVTGFNLFFAPRYVVSRFQLLGGQPLYRGSAKTRKLVAYEYAKFLIGLSVVYGLAKSAGGEIETDIRSPDYGKIKIGDNVIDPLSGLSQQLSFVGRMGTGEKVNTKTGEVQDLVDPDFGGPSIKTEAERYVRSKLSPAAALGYDIMNRKGFDNKPLTAGAIAETILTPINVGDVYEIMKDNNIPAGVAYSIINTAGMGVSSRKED